MYKYLAALVLGLNLTISPGNLSALESVSVPPNGKSTVPVQCFKDILGHILIDFEVQVVIDGSGPGVQLQFLKIQEALRHYGILTTFEVVEESGKPSVGTYTFYRDIKSFR